MKIGQAIKMIRTRRGLSLTELSRRSGCSVSYLSMLETGGRQDPTISKVKTIAQSLNVPIEILFFLAADKNELVGIDKDLSAQLATAALEFLRDADEQPSLI